MPNIKKLKGVISFVLLFAIILQFSPKLRVSSAYEPPFELHSEGVYMVNLETDAVIASKNEFERFYPASLTKIMTAIIVMENCPDLSQSVRVGSDAFNEFWLGDPNKEGIASAGLEPGQENLTYRDCLNALMISSACEAANILALNLCGSVWEFTEMMNGKAEELGCKDTHFSNAHGLWERDNYTTPYDMYLIARYGWEQVEGFAELCDTDTYSLPPNTANPEGYELYNVNPLLSPKSDYYVSYAHGIKTGSIDYYYDEYGNTYEGMKCMVSTAQKDGLSYMTVTMQAPFFNNDGERESYAAEDHRNLYDWAYDSFEYREAVAEGEIFASADVEQYKNRKVDLAAKTGLYMLLPKDTGEGSPVETKVRLFAQSFEAPVSKGDVLGSLDVYYRGEVVETIDLVAVKSVGVSSSANSLQELFGGLLENKWIMYAAAVMSFCLIAV